MISIIKTIRSLFNSSESPERDDTDMPSEETVRPNDRILSRRERILEWRSDVNGDINHVKKDIRTHVYTCKAEDDRFLAETEKVLSGMTTTLATMEYRIERVDEEILEIINKFPANRPCTIDVIAEEIGMPYQIVYDCLVKRESFSPVDGMSNYMEMTYPVWHNKFSLHSTRWLTGSHIYRTTFSKHGTSQYFEIIKPPNWRFVASKDVTYLERVE